MTERRESFVLNLNFPAGRLNVHNDTFMVSSDSHLREFDFLCFFDSRGSTLDEDKTYSISGLLIEYFRSIGSTYFVVCRPLEITVFFSLFNFLHLNDYRARNLITNMGFVDFTPKKSEFIEDIQSQKALLFDNIKCKVECLEEYTLSDGSREVLRYLDINPCAHAFSNCLDKQFESIYLVKTPEFEPKCKFPRQRPDTFYSQLKKTNIFIDRIAELSKKIKPVNLSDNQDIFDNDYLEFSYDGVHYTQFGHNFVFKKICESIESDST